jgi:hypothetical protein
VTRGQAFEDARAAKFNGALTINHDLAVLNPALSFPVYYSYPSIFMDCEWLLSTLFDASLLSLRAAGNGGSFLFRFGADLSGRLPFRKHCGRTALHARPDPVLSGQ